MSFVLQIDKPILGSKRSTKTLPFRSIEERTEWSKANEPIQRIRIQDTTVV